MLTTLAGSTGGSSDEKQTEQPRALVFKCCWPGGAYNYVSHNHFTLIITCVFVITVGT